MASPSSTSSDEGEMKIALPRKISLYTKKKLDGASGPKSYEGMKIFPDGEMTPVVFDCTTWETQIGVYTNRTNVKMQKCTRYYDHHFIIIFEEFTDLQITFLQEQGIRCPQRNRYSDLFDIKMYGTILVVDDFNTITSDQLNSLWKYRIF